MPGVDLYGLDPKKVHIILLGPFQYLHPLKGAPGVGPIEGRNQPLGAKVEFLTPNAKIGPVLVIPLVNPKVEKGVEQIGFVHIRKHGGVVLAMFFGTNKLDVAPDSIPVPEIPIKSFPVKPVVFVEFPIELADDIFPPKPDFAPKGHGPIVVGMDPFQPIEPILFDVGHLSLEVAPIGFKKGHQHRRDAGERDFRRGLAGESLYPVPKGVVPLPYGHGAVIFKLG